MLSVRDIIEKWPSAAEMARDLGLRRPAHGAMMKMRGSIPSQHWPRLVDAAARRGLEGVTFETLAKAHAAAPRSEPEPGSSETSSAPALSSSGGKPAPASTACAGGRP